MRIAFVLLALAATGCYYRPAQAPQPAAPAIASAPAPAPASAPASTAAPPPVSVPKPAPAPAPAPAAVSPSVDVASLPDFRPETAAACNSVRMSVAVAADGSLSVNDAAVDMAGLKAAAAKKNAACQHVAAAVNLAIAPGVPDKRADEIRDALAGAIKNLALIEA